MPSFVNPALLFGLLILAAPILIHLINLMRHKRIQWAAMEFLLASQKKNNTWIRLKELLLLLLRLAAIAAVVLMLAQPLLQNQWSRLLGGTRTHHIVLLDDSFSMADRWSNTSAFAEAKGAIERLGDQAAKQSTAQTFTLLRFSRVHANGGGTQTDLFEENVNADFSQKLQNTLAPMAPSQLAVGVAPTLEALSDLLGEPEGEERVVYIVSDFRAREWEEPGDLADRLAKLNESTAQLNLVNCVDEARPNLAIAALKPKPGTRAVGVPLTMQVTVRNFGGARVEDLSVMLQEDGKERPALVIDEIAPGKSETRDFEVRFATAGAHQVTATLQSDSVKTDNLRYALVDMPLGVPVLLIDGDPDTKSARFLSSVMAPGGSVRTGIDPQIEPPAYLNNHPLDKYHSIYLLDIDRLDQSAIDALEKYVRAGGGLGCFVGPLTRARFVNEQLYREGQGFFPLPLGGETQLLVDRLEKGADLEVADHAIFKIFAGERNSFIGGVTIGRYYSAAKGWEPKPDSGTSVIARLRNGAPLAVERKFGEGRVVAVLTTAAPLWNNWAANPTFVVTILELQSFLAARDIQDTRVVGSPIELEMDPTRYQRSVRLLAPGLGENGSLSTDAVQGPEGLKAVFSDTSASGVYEAQLTTTDNANEVRRFAVNVEADEGDLTAVDRDRLAARLENVRYDYRRASDFQFAPHELAGSNLSDWLLYLLVIGLIGEQLLAYSASYHPPAKEGAR